MPDDTPKRKYPSGASKRRKKYEAQDREVAALGRSQGTTQSGPTCPCDCHNDDGKWAEDFKAAGNPDLENPETDLAYVRKLQMICLRQMTTTPHPSVAQQNAWRRIGEMSKGCGMTSSRAALEVTVKKLRKQIETRRQGGTIIEGPVNTIVRPPNARGGARGPRPLPPDGAPPTE